MDDNVARLLEQLAAKLGTTSEYLWRVLIRQAPIDGFVTLVQFGAVAASVYGLYRFTRCALNYKSKGWEDDTPILMTIGLTIGWVFVIVLLIASISALPLLAASFFNPEYWALHEVLSALKRR